MNKTLTAQELLESGILEIYVIGQTDAEETQLVEEMSAKHPEIKSALNDISFALEEYATTHAVAPSPAVKPFVMASLNYMARMEAGEKAEFPPVITENSKISDYASWLSRPDLRLNEELEDAKALIIGYTPEMITAIVWLKQGALPEVHHDEHEKFLIVEGSCCITIDNIEHHLVAGSSITIPLHVDHSVIVTSDVPCKIILQRLAA
ncbi:MAG: cupin domain-containing protein [Chitinophagaceae bacterium]